MRAEFQAIGLTKGGRNSKIHAFVDEFLRPWVLILTPGTPPTVSWRKNVSLILGIKELLAFKFYRAAFGVFCLCCGYVGNVLALSKLCGTQSVMSTAFALLSLRAQRHDAQGGKPRREAFRSNH
jgi:hypothetical protein